MVGGKSVSPNPSGFGRCTEGQCWQPGPWRAAAGGFSGAERGCCGKGPALPGSARCHGNKAASLIGMRVDTKPPSAVLLASPPAAPVPVWLRLPCTKWVGGEQVWRDPVGLRLQKCPRRKG